jgi:hypothetical protein
MNKKSTADKVEPFVCGGISAMIASTAIHPIDLAKVRLQLMERGAPKPWFGAIIADIARKYGISA